MFFREEVGPMVEKKEKKRPKATKEAELKVREAKRYHRLSVAQVAGTNRKAHPRVFFSDYSSDVWSL